METNTRLGTIPQRLRQRLDERGAAKRFGPDVLPLAALVPGYDRNREAALAMLEWLEARVDVDATLAAAIRELAAALA